MGRSWTTWEVQRILKDYGTLPSQVIAHELDRSAGSVRHKACRLFIKVGTNRKLAAAFRSKCVSTVDAKIFDQTDDRSTLALGFAFSCGSLKLKYRRVLKISVHASHGDNLKWFLSLIASKHSIQTHGNRLVVEIGNSYLVDALVDRWGVLPSLSHPDPPLPPICEQYLRAFSVGHIRGSGLITNSLARWTGTPTITRAISQFLMRHLAIPVPRKIELGRILNVVWTDPAEVVQIKRFLEL